MQRIRDTFLKLDRRRERALITFLTAGDPNLDTSLRLMHEVVAAGADIIEIGVPFSDPMADGPVIQRSSERALAQDTNLKRVLGLVKAFRISNTATPVVLMGYTNPIEAFGTRNFAESARDVGVDGVLVVDSPPEECADLAGLLKSKGIAPIFLISPTTTEERMAAIGRLAEGFVYYVSLRGITGATHLDLEDAQARIDLLRKYTAVPIGIGFGIASAEMAAQAGRIADAVIVGSRIMQEMETPSSIPLQNRVHDVVAQMRAAMTEEECESACI
jgi:tryptophan synthase alpha chain